MNTFQVTAPKLGPGGKVERDPSNPSEPLFVTTDMRWDEFKKQFNTFLEQTAAIPQLRGYLAPKFIYYVKPLNELTRYVLKVSKMPGNTRYMIDGIRQSISSGPADMLQRTYSDGIDDLIVAIENKLLNAKVSIGGRRRKTRKTRKTRRRN